MSLLYNLIITNMSAAYRVLLHFDIKQDIENQSI